MLPFESGSMSVFPLLSRCVLSALSGSDVTAVSMDVKFDNKKTSYANCCERKAYMLDHSLLEVCSLVVFLSPLSFEALTIVHTANVRSYLVLVATEQKHKILFR